MRIAENTILITGGGSGIGRGIAEAFHKRGNQVIISGRSQAKLDEVTRAHPGMASMTVDLTDADDLNRFAREAVERFPSLNVLINNAGIMRPERVSSGDLADAEATVATNLLAPIRLTGALLPQLSKQPQSALLGVSSGLAFVPMVLTPTYSATKSAIHAYTMAIREQLRDTSIQVIEIIPPYVQTELMGAQQAEDERAMPLDEYLAETMQLLESQPDAEEIVVKRCEPLRFAAERGSFREIFKTLNSRSH